MEGNPNKKGVWLSWLPLLLAGLGAGHQVATWPVRLHYPGEINVVEEMQLGEMQHLHQGVAVYAPASPERFDAMNYGPLYYLLGARLIDPEGPAYWPLRLLSSLATLGLAAAAALLAFWLVGSYLAAALAALLFLAYGLVTVHGTSARADSVAMLVVFSGFLVAYRFRDSRKVLLAVPVILIGLYYKQQFVAAPLAILLSLAMQRRYRLAAEFAGLLAMGGIGLALLFQFVVFRGQDFLLHFVRYNLLSWLWFKFQTGLMFIAWVLALPALLAVIFLRSHPDKLLSCYLGCACLLNALSYARIGSNTNYFFDCFLILSILVACWVATRLASRALEVLVLLALVVFLGQLWVPTAPQARDFSQDRAIQEFLRGHFAPGTRALGFCAGDLVRAGLENPIADIWMYGQLIHKGRVSDRDLRNEVDRHRFGIIVVSFDLRSQDPPTAGEFYLTEPVRRAILMNYRPLPSQELPNPERFEPTYGFHAWVPK
jgi:hypothetical protein